MSVEEILALVPAGEFTLESGYEVGPIFGEKIKFKNKTVSLVNRSAYDTVCAMLRLAVEQRDNALVEGDKTVDFWDSIEGRERDNAALARIARGETV
jgi:hypothetical protein